MNKLRLLKGARCTGYDFSGQAIDIVRKKGFEGHVADVRNFQANGDSQTYDVVVATHVLEHVQEDKAFLETLLSLCKKGGRVIVATPHLKEVQDITEHVRGYEEDEIGRLMTSVFPLVSVSKNARDYIAIAKVQKETP